MSDAILTVPETRVSAGIRAPLTLLASAVSGLAVAGLILLIVCIQFLGFHALTVLSGSMTPTFVKGDVVVTRPIAVNKVKLHDVVLFRSAAAKHPEVVHRVVGFINIEMDTVHRSTGKTTVTHTHLLRTKGDANPLPDPSPVSPQQLRGKVWFTVPGLGRVLRRAGLATLLPFIAGISGVAWLFSEVRARRRRPDVAG